MTKPEDDALERLTHKAAEYPPERYPVQHATAQFHLGLTLANAGRIEEAEDALNTAVGLFGSHLPVEEATALNALGATLRLAAKHSDAQRCFERAAELFERRDMAAELGAALFNLGLVHKDVGEVESAAAAFRRARDHFDADALPRQTSNLCRELGAALLLGGDVDGAVEVLVQAEALAERAHDAAASAACANTLGLAYLAANRVDEAVTTLERSVAANPRRVRPEGYSMSKANLATAYERAGRSDRASIAARHALAVPGAPPAVLDQASAVHERVGERRGAILAVLDDEPRERWEALMRDEVATWAALDESARRVEIGAWIEGHLDRPEHAADLAETVLNVLLELPPDEMETVVATIVEEVGRRDPSAANDVRAQMSRAMAAFHIPQWTRLKEMFNTYARALDQQATWG